MYCYYCGKEISDDSEFCPFCGNPVDTNANNQQAPGEGYYEENPVYEENLRRHSEREEKSNKNVILLVCITVLSLVICVLIAIMAINAANKKDDSTPVPTATVEVTVEPTREPEEHVYYVRTTPYDESTGLGSYDSFNEAKDIADANKNKGYKVYDSEGTLLYSPVDVPTQAPKSTSAQSTGKVNYWVRTSAYNEASQIGAFEYYDNAKRMADQNKNLGYKVYDTNGNLIYSPSSAQTQTQSQSTGGVNYRVRTAPDDADTQIGAFKNYDYAKRMADQNKARGYKVYDMQGNLVYAP